ncbi:MAG: hypothetical protein HC907_34930 [Richelia sp. SM1_7_0]|nr:hypothetical protein [Richelia sp. SM1_7_0]
MLGSSGSGKTVFLSSLYKRLSTQGELGFFLEVDGEEKRKRLINLYKQVAIEKKWPPGTKYSEISEWIFTCSVQTQELPIYSACQFEYLDYAGGRLTDESEEEDYEFEGKLKNADALLGLLDGQRLRSLMRNEQLGTIWAISDLPNILSVMQRNKNPVHFVISKWDILEEEYSLEEIRNRLFQIEEFKNLVNLRNKAGSPIRLIPISAVGKGFATLQPDGSMLKKLEGLPQPFQVEIPLACVLPDMIQAQLKELVQKREQEENTVIEVKPSLSLWDTLSQAFGVGLRVIRDVLPKKYQFADDILESLIQLADESAQQKQEAAIKRTEELRQKQAESLNKVSSEETALKYAIDCFISIRSQLDYQFPESNLKDI